MTSPGEAPPAAKKRAQDKRLDLALEHLHGRVSKLEDDMNNFSRDLQK